MTTSEQNILTKTRAEEHEADVWGEFYIPPYFNRLSLKTATKSTYIVGKRGCGKTMLLTKITGLSCYDFISSYKSLCQGFAADFTR